MAVEQRTAAQLIVSRQGVAQRVVQGVWKFAKDNPLGAVSALIIGVFLIGAVFADVLPHRDPILTNVKAALKGPFSSGYIFGADNLGRDYYSRLLFGARTSLIVAFSAMLIGQGGGGALGMISGYFGGKTDMFVQRFMDVIMAFPALVLAMAIVSALGPTVLNVVIAISVVQVPRASRVMRSTVLSLKEFQYVEAARANGAQEWVILARHILPNAMAPLIVIATLNLGVAIVTEASLSFLGVGPPPPDPTWGQMIADTGRRFAETAPWLAVFPGLAIFFIVLAFNLLGDAIRDATDPRLRKG